MAVSASNPRISWKAEVWDLWVQGHLRLHSKTLSQKPSFSSHLSRLGWGAFYPKGRKMVATKITKYLWRWSILGPNFWKVQQACWATNWLWRWPEKAKHNGSFSPTTQLWGKLKSYHKRLDKAIAHQHSGNNIDLGPACRKYYSVYMLTAVDLGASDVIRSMPSQIAEK